MKKALIPTLLCDFYKVSHREQYPDKTEVVYSTWTPRSGKHAPKIKDVVAVGFQGFVVEYLQNYFNECFFNRPKEDVVKEYSRYIKHCLFVQEPYTKHIEELHDLGYLPLLIKAVDEGTLIPFRVPMLTVENTDNGFFWLTNYFETLISTNLWKISTTASIARVYRQILDKAAIETTGTTMGVEFQGHDFALRGMSGLEDGARSGMGHLLSFVGTDTIPAIQYAEYYYGANIEEELVGCSVNATEHSVMCAGGKEDELETYRRLIQDTYPTGIISIVSDTWDLWHVIQNTLPKLKDLIMARDGGPESIDKVVIRPDSGDPVKILCGTEIIEDFSNDCKDLKTAILWAVDGFEDKFREETEHGEHGDSGFTGYFKFQEKHYELKLEFFWNRHDKQYYYLDETTVKSCEECELTPEQKGVVELLWDEFGGTMTDQGYKVLDSHIGAIYGDAITLERCQAICNRLKEKGFASTNVVYGIGSYTYQLITRDTLGFAMKSTSVTIDGEQKAIFKDPVTDDGIKKSAVGRVIVTTNPENGATNVWDETDVVRPDLPDLLTPLFLDGKLMKTTTLGKIREKLRE